MRANRRRFRATAVLCTIALVPSAASALAGHTATPRLPLNAGVRLAAGGYELIQHGGDFNGDGLGDFALGDENRLWVVFGTRHPHLLNLRALGRAGLTVIGRGSLTDETNDANSAMLGDVNGDSRADLAVGLPEDSPNGRTRAGSIAVIYGGAGGTIDVRKPLGARGFRIIGPKGDATPGGKNASVLTYDYPPAAVGDVNGDGLADIAVSVGGSPPGGSIWIVFGSRANTDVDLADPGSRAVRITPEPVEVARAGDVNGDGIGDLVFGYPDWNQNKGAAYVLYGARDFKPIDFFLNGLGARGFRVTGHSQDAPDTSCPDTEMPCDDLHGDNGNQVGGSVGAAGDVNRDGIDDLVVGAPGVNFHGVDSGAVFVVYGRRQRSDVEISRLASRGFEIGGAYAEENFGGSVSGGEQEGFLTTGAGDMNGDRCPDLLLLSSDDPELPPQRAYAVLSPRRARTMAISTLGGDGYRFLPTLGKPDRGSWISGLSAVGDFDGDGRADAVVVGSARRRSGPGVYLFRLPRRAAP